MAFVSGRLKVCAKRSVVLGRKIAVGFTLTLCSGQETAVGIELEIERSLRDALLGYSASGSVG